MQRKALSEKIIVLGVDGMDPRLTSKYVKMGIMPNTQKIIERGSAREDLVLLGGQPTVTPPMWTTLATGAYPMTHGITCFNGQGDDLDKTVYNIDSRRCKAELAWDIFAENGKKTLVWHWPGSSWPPTSDSPNLAVVDGLTPAVVNAIAMVDGESLLVADVRTPEPYFRAKAASDGNVPCVIADLNETKEKTADSNMGSTSLILYPGDGEHALSDNPFDVVLSPIKEASGWAVTSLDAKECVFLFSGGLIRRPALILKNEQGIYDQVAIYKNKKEEKPLAVLKNNVFYPDYTDEAVVRDEKVVANRHFRIIEMKEDGTHFKLWMSPSLDIHNNSVWHPQALYQKVVDAVGYCKPYSLVGGGNRQLIEDCMGVTWDYVAQWTADALLYLIQEEKFEIIFSHLHNLDLQGHMIVKHLKDHGKNKLSEAVYEQLVRRMYVQTDQYLARFMHLLDEGWTLLIVSDHAQIAPENEPLLMGDGTGINVRFMEELGLTAVKKDENGHDLYEIDWTQTLAVAPRGNHIYLNLKGRSDHGIIEPKDQFEVEEEVMTRLYGYRHPETGKRVIALALRNKDAVLLGMGGPECGDILYWNAEGYNYDHNDSLSTTYGVQDTSVSPIFIAAGAGVKENYKIERVIRQVDVTPTMAVLGGIRMPAQCEGAPMYQLFTEEY